VGSVPQLNYGRQGHTAQRFLANDRHIDAINTLVAKQIGSNAVQTTVMAQAPTGFDAVTEESFQVVYAASHWVAAACVDGQVVIAVSATLCHRLYASN